MAPAALRPRSDFHRTWTAGRWSGCENFRTYSRGDWRKYSAFDAAFRPEEREVDSPGGACHVSHLPGVDGTHVLQLIPIAEAMVYILLRAIQDDVPEDDLCGALPGERFR